MRGNRVNTCRSRRTVASAALALASVVALAACGSTSSAKGGGASGGLPSTVNIGAITSLSGPSAASCRPEADGMNLAVQVAQSQHLLGSSNIKIDITDDQSTGTGGVTGFSKLVSQHPAGIVGLCLSTVAQAVVPLIDRDHVPVVITTAAASSFVTPKFAFRGEIPQPVYAKATVDYLATQHVKSVAAVVNTTLPTVSQLWSGTFKPELEKLGIKIDYEADVSSSVVDFTSQVARIQQAHPDAIVNLENGPNSIPLQKQLRAAGLTQPVVGQLSFDTSAFRTLPSAVGAVYATNYAPVFKAPSTVSFTTAFTAKYGHAPSGIAAGAYDSTMRMITAIASAKSVSNDAVQAARAAQTTASGAQGTLSFTSTGDVTGSGGVVRIDKGPTLVLVSGGN
jgi:branched-chain amino acid transport system substrate-binding protein